MNAARVGISATLPASLPATVLLLLALSPQLLSGVAQAGMAEADALQTTAPVAFIDGWIRPPLVRGGVAAGYGQIRNESGEHVTITGFRGRPASTGNPVTVELHETVHDGDMVRMRRIEALGVAAGATVSLEPGGKHLMIFGMARGRETMTLLLELDDGRTMPVSFAVGLPE